MKNIDDLCEDALEDKYRNVDYIYEFTNIKERFLLIPDFNSPYGVWEKVIMEFISNYSADDDVALILYIDDIDLYDDQIKYIIRVMNSKYNPPIICIEIKEEFPDELNLLKSGNYFIANRDIITVKMIDYAHDYGVKIISGMKGKIFEDIKLYYDISLCE